MTLVELERIARAAIPPVAMTDVCAVVDVEPSARLTDDRTPAGLVVDADGSRRAPRTRYGVAWIIDGRAKSKPIALLDRQIDAFILIDLLRTGTSSRPARRSVAGTGPAARGGTGPAEGRADPADAVPTTAAAPSSPADAGTTGDLEPARRQQRAARSLERPAGSRPGPSDAPPAGTCKACGLSLEGRAIRTRGPLRETCDDACRQAYKRGARAPIVGVVDEAAIEALSRVPKPIHEDGGVWQQDEAPW